MPKIVFHKDSQCVTGEDCTNKVRENPTSYHSELEIDLNEKLLTSFQ
jgi:hypothetical protein